MDAMSHVSATRSPWREGAVCSQSSVWSSSPSKNFMDSPEYCPSGGFC
jgi:hypothetical protein